MADFNGDGNLDLYLAKGNVNNQLFFGDGAGGFVEETRDNPAVNNTPGWSQHTAVLDLNGDGLPDLYVANHDSTSNQLFFADGAGGFVEETEGPAVGGTSISSTHTAVSDFNGDGVLDLYVSNQDENNQLFYSDGAGGLIEETEGPAVTNTADNSKHTAVGFAMRRSDESNDDTTVIGYIADSMPELVGTTVVNDGEWHTVVLTRAGPTFTLTVDGAEDATANWEGEFAPGSFLWGRGDDYHSNFIGSIGVTGLWNRALGFQQVANTLSNAEATPTALVAIWPTPDSKVCTPTLVRGTAYWNSSDFPPCPSDCGATTTTQYRSVVCTADNVTYSFAPGSTEEVHYRVPYADSACRLLREASAVRLRKPIDRRQCTATPPCASCTDLLRNGDETGRDCGGSCPPCPIPASAAQCLLPELMPAWMDVSDECGGWKVLPGNETWAFENWHIAVAAENTFQPDVDYKCPYGHHWATYSEFESIILPQCATLGNTYEGDDPIRLVGTPTYQEQCGWDERGSWNEKTRGAFYGQGGAWAMKVDESACSLHLDPDGLHGCFGDHTGVWEDFVDFPLGHLPNQNFCRSCDQSNCDNCNNDMYRIKDGQCGWNTGQYHYGGGGGGQGQRVPGRQPSAQRQLGSSWVERSVGLDKRWQLCTKQVAREQHRLQRPGPE